MSLKNDGFLHKISAHFSSFYPSGISFIAEHRVLSSHAPFCKGFDICIGVQEDNK